MKISGFTSRFLVTAAFVCAGPSLAVAQEFSEAFVRCGDLAEDGARLRCFDGLLPQARKSEAERHAEAAAEAKAEFGLTPVQRNERASREAPEKVARKQALRQESERVEGTIAALDMNPLGAVFTLDNGQVWQTTSFGRLSTVPRIGQKVLVSSGPLGGYRLKLEGKIAEVGVKRLK